MENEHPKRGDVYWIRLDPTQGREISKTRPCIIISNDILNRYSEIILVIPVTSTIDKIYHGIEVEVVVDGKKGKAQLLQARSIDKKNRLGKRIGTISNEEMENIKLGLRKTLGL